MIALNPLWTCQLQNRVCSKMYFKFDDFLRFKQMQLNRSNNIFWFTRPQRVYRLWASISYMYNGIRSLYHVVHHILDINLTIERDYFFVQVFIILRIITGNVNCTACPINYVYVYNRISVKITHITHWVDILSCAWQCKFLKTKLKKHQPKRHGGAFKLVLEYTADETAHA